jgi:hypothetical protein
MTLDDLLGAANAHDLRLHLAPVAPSERVGLVRYPVPLAGTRFAHLHLPDDLTRADVERLVDFLVSLAPEPEAAA